METRSSIQMEKQLLCEVAGVTLCVYTMSCNVVVILTLIAPTYSPSITFIQWTIMGFSILLNSTSVSFRTRGCCSALSFCLRGQHPNPNVALSPSYSLSHLPLCGCTWEAVEDDQGAWVTMTQEWDSAGTPGSWFWSGRDLCVVAIWGVNR